MSSGLIDVLIQVITSWQVLAVTGALIIYFFLVFRAARGPRRSQVVARTTPGAKTKAASTGQPDVETTEEDDLGLTEEE
jgi:hypothetical protein